MGAGFKPADAQGTDQEQGQQEQGNQGVFQPGPHDSHADGPVDTAPDEGADQHGRYPADQGHPGETGGEQNGGLETDGEEAGRYRQDSPAIDEVSGPLVGGVAKELADSFKAATAGGGQPAQSKDDVGTENSHRPEKTDGGGPMECIEPVPHSAQFTGWLRWGPEA